MGYDRANRFLQMLEDAGIISEQKKGTKLPRTVNLDKLEGFLNRHGDTGSAGGAASNQALDSSDMLTDVESTQDQDTESPAEISDAQVQLSPSASPQSGSFEISSNFIKENSIRNQFRKGRHN